MCPRSSLIRFVVHDDASTGRYHREAIEVIVSKEVSVGEKFWINSGLTEEVQSDDGCVGCELSAAVLSVTGTNFSIKQPSL